MTDTFRALCAELLSAMDTLYRQSVTTPYSQAIEIDGIRHAIPIGKDILAQDAVYADLMDRARAALAQPEGASTYRLLRYIEELSGVLESSAEMIQEWGNYANKYFQEKHCLEANVAYAKSNAARAKRIARQTDNLGEYDD
jgi:hypothetical protein